MPQKVEITATIGRTLRDSYVFIDGKEIPIVSLELNMGVNKISTIKIETILGRLNFTSEAVVNAKNDASKIIKELLKRYKRKGENNGSAV